MKGFLWWLIGVLTGFALAALLERSREAAEQDAESLAQGISERLDQLEAELSDAKAS